MLGPFLQRWFSGPTPAGKKQQFVGKRRQECNGSSSFQGQDGVGGKTKNTPFHMHFDLALEIRHDSLTNSNWTAVVSENVCCVRMVLGIFSFCKSYFHSPSGEHVSAICMHAENKCWRGNNLWEEEIAGNFLGNMGWSRASTSPLEGVSKLFRAFFFGIFFLQIF